MSTTTHASADAITLQTGASPTACALVLHGLGADGNDFVRRPVGARLQGRLARLCDGPQRLSEEVADLQAFLLRVLA